MPFSRRRRHAGPTPLAELAQQTGLELTTRTWLERTVADVAFDDFVFGRDVLCNEAADGSLGALERGIRADGVMIAIGSMEWREMPIDWIGVQSKRGADHLDLARDRSAEPVGHQRFDDRFVVDADDIEVVRDVLTDDLCDWAVDADDEHGPLIVLFDGAEDETDDDPGHGSAVFVAREVADDSALVATLDITIELVTGLRSALESRTDT
jgi:hypothetical protein